ncbi:hypothetical protein N2152v2_010527 [Parachlorella kessleri]
MPALHLFGTRWNVASDYFSIYALLLLIYHVIWLFMYWIGLVAFTLPEDCPGEGKNVQQYVFVYLQLLVYVLWVVMAATMLLISLRGAPLETSKRRWLKPLIYTYVLSWLPGWGVLAYSVSVLYSTDTCWASGSKSMMALMVFGAMGILAGIAFTILTTHLLVDEVRPGVKWHAVKKGVSTCAGVYTWLLHRYRGPMLPLEELATEYMDRHGSNPLDLDKSDVVAALVCARLVQRERRHALMVDRLRAAGVLAGDAMRTDRAVPAAAATAGTAVGVSGSGRDGSNKVYPQGNGGWVEVTSVAAATQGAAAQGGPENGHVVTQPQQKEGAQQEDVMQWIRAVCAGQGVCVAPSSGALRLAPGLTPQQAADLCTDVQGRADQPVLADALHWARYAAAAYGRDGYLWTVEGRNALSASRHLSQLAQQAQREGKLPQGPSPAPKAFARDCVAAQGVLQPQGGAGREIVYLNPGDAEKGQLGYLVAVDRERGSVVLSIGGARRYQPMAEEPVPLPPGWVAPTVEAKADGAHAVHAGALAAAQHILADLDAAGTLASLLPQGAAPAAARQQASLVPPTVQQMPGPPAAAPAAAETQTFTLPVLVQHPPVGSSPAPGPTIVTRPASRAMLAANGSTSPLKAKAAMSSRTAVDGGVAASSTGFPRPASAAGEAAAALHASQEPLQQTPAGLTELGSNTGSKAAEPVGATPIAGITAAAAAANGHGAPLGLPDAGRRLVLTGHGLGAGVAALLGLNLQQRYPDLQVWAFDPPGGLCDPALSHTLAPSTVSVILGKSASPRTSTSSVPALIEEGIVGLARLRYHKGLMLLALLLEKAGPRSWRGKWLNPARALHSPESIPQEPLQYLARFHSEQLSQHRLSAIAATPTTTACLPGRVLFLRRLKPAASAQQAQHENVPVGAAAASMEAGMAPSQQGFTGATPMAPTLPATVAQERDVDCCGGCCGGCRPLLGAKAGRKASLKSWDAVWVTPEDVAGEGILVSKRSLHDHYVSRLLSVLQRVAVSDAHS